MAAGLASLGYPGFRQLTGVQPQNPATILLAAVATGDVEVRVLEALPWLAVQYNNLDWEWLIREAKVREYLSRAAPLDLSVLGLCARIRRRLIFRRLS